MVHAGLAGLGMYVVLSSLVIAVENLRFDTETTQFIIDRISKDTQNAFTQNLAEDGADPNHIAFISDVIILPFFELIPEYIDETIKRVESDANDLTPPSRSGILPIVLRQALGEEKAYEIISGNFLEFYGVLWLIDGLFVDLMKNMPEKIEKLLRSPMGSEYGI